MQINPISFGKKIPLTKAQVLNKKTGKNEPVTLYEYDCKDLSDIAYVRSQKGDWTYKRAILEGMLDKHSDKESESKFNYYSLERQNGEILGLVETEDDYDDEQKTKDVMFIEVKNPWEYRFCGQVMLASLGDLVLNTNKDKLVINKPVKTAIKFYKDTCGFVEGDVPYDDLRYFLDSGYKLQMDRNQLEGFIKQTEKRTKHPIINLTA